MLKEAMARLAREKSMKKKEEIKLNNDKSKHPSSKTKTRDGDNRYGRKTSGNINSRDSLTGNGVASMPVEVNNNDAIIADLKNGIWTPSSASASLTMVDKFHRGVDGNSYKNLCSEVHNILFTIVEEEDGESDGACESLPSGDAVELSCQPNRRQNRSSMQPQLHPMLEEDGVAVGYSVPPVAAFFVAASARPQSMTKQEGMKVIERGDTFKTRNIDDVIISATAVKAAGTATKTPSSATTSKKVSSATPLRTESSAMTSKTASSATASKAASAATATNASAEETKAKSAETSPNEDLKLSPSPPHKTWGQILRQKHDEVSLITDDPKDSFPPVPLIIAFVAEKKHEFDARDSSHHYNDCDVLDAVVSPPSKTTCNDDYNRTPQNSQNQQENKMFISNPTDDDDDDDDDGSIHCGEESSCSSYNGSNPSNLTEEQKDEMDELISHDGSDYDDNRDDAHCVLVVSKKLTLESDLLCSSYCDSNPSNRTEEPKDDVDESIPHDGSGYGDNRDDAQENTALDPGEDHQLAKALAPGSSDSGCVFDVPESTMLDSDLLYDDLGDKDIDELQSSDDGDCGKKYDEALNLIRMKLGSRRRRTKNHRVAGETTHIGKEEKEVYDDAEHDSCDGVDLHSPPLVSESRFEQKITLRRQRSPSMKSAETPATEAQKGKVEQGQEDDDLPSLRKSCPSLLSLTPKDTMLKRRGSFKKKRAISAEARGKPACANATAPANKSSQEGVPDEKKSHSDCTEEDGTTAKDGFLPKKSVLTKLPNVTFERVTSIIPADIVATRHLVHAKISSHRVQSRKGDQSSSDLDPTRPSERAKDYENNENIVNREFQDGSFASVKSEEQETLVVEQHHASSQRNSQVASNHRVHNHGRGQQQQQHIRGGCASIRCSNRASSDPSLKSMSLSDNIGDHPPRHHESINYRIATDDDRGCGRDSSNVSWEDLEYAVKYCMSVSLSDTNEKLHANNDCGNLLQPDASNYSRRQEISDCSRGQGGGHDVSWDELGDVITKGRIKSINDIARQVIQKQQEEWDFEAGRKESLANKPWKCETCTFINENGIYLLCGVCDTPRYQLTEYQARGPRRCD